MTEERCKELMVQVGYPNSVTIQQLIFQVANETEQKIRNSKVDKVNNFTNNPKKAEIFECLDRLEYCSPKSEPWIKENAKSIRNLVQKLQTV